jgi:hypothetical protein
MEQTFQKIKKMHRYQNEDNTFWKRHIDEFLISKTSQKIYCKNQNISYGRFSYWKKILSPKIVKIKKTIIPKKSSLLPVRIKAETSSHEGEILCRLTFNNGSVLTICHERALSLVLARAM